MEQLITDFLKLPISNDFLFKHVLLFKPICKHILEELFHTEIADITYLQSEETIDVYPNSHGIRLDVKIADANNTHYNLEMQVKNPKNPKTGNKLLPKRTRYYQAMLDVDMLQKGRIMTSLLPLTLSSSVSLISSRLVNASTPLGSAVWKILILNCRTKLPLFS